METKTFKLADSKNDMTVLDIANYIGITISVSTRRESNTHILL